MPMGFQKTPSPQRKLIDSWCSSKAHQCQSQAQPWRTDTRMI